MKFSPLWLTAGVLLSGAVTGCGGPGSAPLRDPTGAQSNPVPSTPMTVDPASGTRDLNSESNSATAPPGAPESAADPAGHPPVVSSGSGTGDTPINSGAGSAEPERAH
ncbi:MAG TPA: hypothetical protein VK745_00555 [Polyangiaceae bacterium]|jgi:hypothetical protein|nr:hypothetical protein [Polyangiaceae bacterium]